MSKFYAVVRGRCDKPTIYNNWDDCKAQIFGFKGAIYKSFGTHTEAEEYIERETKASTQVTDTDKINDDIPSYYVDGSFMEKYRNYSYGVALVHKDQVIFTANGVGKDKEAVAIRNIAGEVLGSMVAVNDAIERGLKEINLFFDYQGIQSWATGGWKQNKKITKMYNQFMQKRKDLIKINFVKVKGHSGNKYNDLVDELARQAFEK